MSGAQLPGESPAKATPQRKDVEMNNTRIMSHCGVPILSHGILETLAFYVEENRFRYLFYVDFLASVGDLSCAGRMLCVVPVCQVEDLNVSNALRHLQEMTTFFRVCLEARHFQCEVMIDRSFVEETSVIFSGPLWSFRLGSFPRAGSLVGLENLGNRIVRSQAWRASRAPRGRPHVHYLRHCLSPHPNRPRSELESWALGPLANS